MKFSTKEDIGAPAEVVFRELSDFAAFERLARARGAQVRRLDRLEHPGPGMSWELAFRWRGRERSLVADLTRFDAPQEIRFDAVSTGFAVTLTLGVIALSPRRTRIAVGLEVTPKTLASRILMQSMKLGKARLDRKFATRVRMMAEEIEFRHAGGAA
ncbi:SRPBCC family protein [Frigidibacter sp. MR17.14]|uniref:SRPBCC family protein n=1 Tax=Frigidibacter sp. MR17.14 TaxID=3126509 RepID=UPI0030130631